MTLDTRRSGVYRNRDLRRANWRKTSGGRLTGWNCPYRRLDHSRPAYAHQEHLAEGALEKEREDGVSVTGPL